jgi:hypothetical protein
MRKSIAAVSLILPMVLAIAPAQATTVIDATGDFLPTYVGPALADLDVTSFSVAYNSSSSIFTLGATFAGSINPSTAGIYVFGVNTGTGTLRPFASLGQGNVIFNQAIVVRKDGTGSIGATTLNPADISITGNILTFKIAASLMPSTGFTPEQYGWNLWPRIGTGNNNQITDFAPENATISVTAVPEPSAWALLIAGFGLIGGTLRMRRRQSLSMV